MNIEIFRLYKNGFRCFDATPTNVTWKFDSDVDNITENTTINNLIANSFIIHHLLIFYSPYIVF